MPDGEHTDFRRAVKLEDGEKVAVVTWLAGPTGHLRRRA